MTSMKKAYARALFRMPDMVMPPKYRTKPSRVNIIRVDMNGTPIVTPPKYSQKPVPLGQVYR